MMIKKRKFILMSLILLSLFLTVSAIGAAEDNSTLGSDLAESDDVIKELNVTVGDTLSDGAEIEDNLESSEGIYLDPTEAYEGLNAFRLEKGVWFWNGDDTTVTYFNTRADNQLLPLVRDEALEETAKIRAKECSVLFEHERPDGTSCFTAYPDYGSGENLARFCTASGCIEMWKETFDVAKDQGHRINMLGGHNCVGIAGYQDQYGGTYWVQAFGWKEIEQNVTPEVTPSYENKMTFDDLNVLVQGGNDITLERDCIYKNNSALSEGILIDRAVTIDGQGHSIDALKIARIFNITSQGVVLKNIIFKNGYSDYGCGGAIYSKAGNLTLYNCTFENNFAYYGSAIYSLSGDICLTDCSFKDNMAAHATLYSNSGNVNISSCDFTDNYAMVDAGAVYLRNGDVKVTDTKFKNNTAFSSGALYAEGVELYMSGCSIIGNTGYKSGAIVLAGSRANISATVFDRNYIKDYYRYARGSSLFANASDVSLSGCEFSNNYGYVGASLSSDMGNLTVEDCRFSNDTSYLDNGIIYITQTSASIRNSNLSNGKAYDRGGAIFSVKSDLEMFSCSMVNFTAQNGGVIYSQDSVIRAEDCSFENSTAIYSGIIYSKNDDIALTGCTFTGGTSLEGAAIYLNEGTLDLNGCEFALNSADSEYESSGGVLRLTNSHVTVSNSLFRENSALTVYNYAMGGAIYSRNCEIDIFNSTFKGHSATIGGAILLEKSKLSAEGVIFENNTGSGAAIFSNESSMTLKSVKVYDNVLSYGWGVIYSERSSLDITESVFTANAADRGGAVYSVYGNLTSKDSAFISNTAYSFGGAIYSYGGNADIINSNFTQNSASSDFGGTGGAIFSENGNLTVSSSLFDANKASDMGGAVFSSGNISVTDSIFSGNSVNSEGYYAFGGALCASSCNGTVENSVFRKNSVNSSYNSLGASIYSSDSDISVNGCSFENESALSGAFIYCDGSHLRVCESDFTNAAASEGGAIYLTGSKSEISASNFTASKASSLGGAIYSTQSDVSIDSCRFADGNSYEGGAIASQTSNMSVSNCAFINNTAVYGGGAIYSYQGNSMLSSSLFASNRAQDGGAVFGCDAEDCTFKDNFASGTAGAIYGQSNTATGCEFINNTAFGDNPTHNVTENGCTYEANRILKRATFDTVNLWSEYYQGDSLYVYVYEGYYHYIDNVTVILTAYRDNVAVKSFEFIVRDGWNVDIDEGSYVFEFSVKNPDYIVTPVNANVTVIKKETANLAIEVSDVTYPEPVLAQFTGNVDGTANIYIDSTFVQSLTVSSAGPSSLPLTGIDAGEHTLSVTLIPQDSKIDQKTFKKTFTVFKKQTSILLEAGDCASGDNIIVNVTSTEDGNVEVRLAGTVRNVNVRADEKTSVDMGVLEKGTYTVDAVFSAGGNYIDSSDSKTIKVSAKISPESIQIKSPEAGSDDMSINLPADAKGTVKLLIAGKTYEADVVNGTAVLRMPQLAGDNPYTITYSGDDNYAGFSVSGVYNPYKNITITPDMQISEFENGVCVVRLPSDSTGTVRLTIADKSYSFDIIGGIAAVTLPALDDGTYQYSIFYSGDDKYGAVSQNSNVRIINPAISAPNLKVTYSAGSYYKITVLGFGAVPVSGASVVIKSNGKAFKTLKTGADGICKFKADQAPGTYKLEITSNGMVVKKTLTVKHLLTLKKVTVKKSAKKLMLTATLGKINKKYLKGKKITFKFNGKKYTAKTDKKGVAKVTVKSSVLKKLKVSKKITYQATYLKDTVKYSVKVKK